MAATNEQLEQRVRDLEREADRGPSRIGGGGGGTGISNVSVLPAIPASGWRVVYHTVEKQKFFAAAGDSYWSPENDWTTNDGLPGS